MSPPLNCSVNSTLFDIRNSAQSRIRRRRDNFTGSAAAGRRSHYARRKISVIHGNSDEWRTLAYTPERSRREVTPGRRRMRGRQLASLARPTDSSLPFIFAAVSTRAPAWWAGADEVYGAPRAKPLRPSPPSPQITVKSRFVTSGGGGVSQSVSERVINGVVVSRIRHRVFGREIRFCHCAALTIVQRQPLI